MRQSGGRFKSIAIPALNALGVCRSAAFCDLDNNGSTDIVVNFNNGTARLLKSNAPAKNWLSVAAPQGSRIELETTGLPTATHYPSTPPAVHLNLFARLR